MHLFTTETELIVNFKVTVGAQKLKKFLYTVPMFSV